MSTHYNLEKLIKINLIESYKSTRYCYKTKKTFLGLTIRKEGFYYDLFREYYDECPEDYFLQDGIVYTKPECTLYYQNNITKTYVFDTLFEAETFRNHIIAGGNFIK